MLGSVRIETQCGSLIGRERYQLSVTDECRIRCGDGATRLPPRPNVEPIWVLRIRWRTFVHFHEALDTGGEPRSSPNRSGGAPRWRPRPRCRATRFHRHRTDDAERIGILAGSKSPLCAHPRNWSGAWLAQLAPLIRSCFIGRISYLAPTSSRMIGSAAVRRSTSVWSFAEKIDSPHPPLGSSTGRSE